METGGSDKFVDTDNIPSDEVNGLNENGNKIQNGSGDETKEYINLRSLDMSDKTYKLESFNKNLMLIFNHINCPGKEPRLGTEHDVEALKSCFENVKFEVQVHKDYTRKQIFDTLDKVTSQDLSDYGCFSIVVLTHGSDDGMLFTNDGGIIYEREIKQYLLASIVPSLATKPRIFIVQTCCESEYLNNVRVEHAQGPDPSGSIRTDNISSPSNYSVPGEADILIIHSTYPGMDSVRNRKTGSWFIQSLCQHINESKEEEDFPSILTRMRSNVSTSTNEIVKTQTLLRTSTLNRVLYLKGRTKTDKEEIDIGVPTETQELIKQFKKHSEKVGNAMEKKVYAMQSNNYFADHRPISETKARFMHKRRTAYSNEAELKDHITFSQEAREWSRNLSTRLFDGFKAS